MTLYCHILPQKPFSKLLQSLKLTTGRKLALLTNYLGRREIIRPKSNRASQRDWVTNLHHYHSELYHRTWMAEENLSVLRQSNRTIKPVSIRHQSHGNGFLVSWSCHTLFHLCIGAMTAAMPRSGGGYVTISRVAHPYVGYIVAWVEYLTTALSF